MNDINSGLMALLTAVAACSSIVGDEALPSLRVENVRRVDFEGPHNAFTDLCQFRGRFYLTFRSCPDGHMVHPTSSIVVLASDDTVTWHKVHQFSVARRDDVRDPHFLVFRDRLFVYTGTWYCGDSSPKTRDLNQHLGYCAHSADGDVWTDPVMLEGTYGHYIWRAATADGKAWLCGRRKKEFSDAPGSDRSAIQSALLVSEDGLVWRTHSLFQETQGDETAFIFQPDGSILAVARRGSGHAEVCRSDPPFLIWDRRPLDRYIGGPLVTQWGSHLLVGGRNTTPNGPRTVLSWLTGTSTLTTGIQLPSDGDNSYPGLVPLEDRHALLSWYSTHERDSNGKPFTGIYLADLWMDPAKTGSE
ncbi:MAG: hypothetical protein R3C49_23265 [Planctomycetaceae bacterium]